MFVVLGILFFFVIVGIICHKAGLSVKFDHTVTYTIYAMLFAFGITIGADPDFFNNIGRFGVQAFILTVAAIAGSIVAAMLAERLLKRKDRHEE